MRFVDEAQLREALRHTLAGEPVITWPRLHLEDLEAVDALLAQNRLEPADAADRRYLCRVHEEAVFFVEEVLGQPLAPQLRRPRDPRTLFLLASGRRGRRRADACMVLKVMNVVHHLNARELRMRLPLSDGDLAFAADTLAYDALTKVQRAGVRVLRFEGGVKARQSLLLKLMTPGYHMADQVPDRVRYRIVVERREDIVPAVKGLMGTLLPFNTLVPGQLRNDLVPLEEALTAPSATARRAEAPAPANPFSGPDFRVLSFVADLPIRCIDFFDAPPSALEAFGPVLFATVEMQIVDAATAEANESGRASHAAYKARQKAAVLARLVPGDESG